MARNVEIKARLRDPAGLVARAASLGGVEVATFEQDDAFYVVPSGRLKLRRSSGRAELIHYRRDDDAGPKVSSYSVVAVAGADADALDALLAAALGRRGRVRKVRRLLAIGRTRVHLDRVEGLGDFLELEVVLEAGEAEDAGLAEARRLMGALGVDAGDLVEGAYVDALAPAAAPVERPLAGAARGGKITGP